MKRDHRTNELLIEVGEADGNRVPKWSKLARMFQNVLEFSGMFYGVPECSRMQENLLKCSRRF